MNTTVLTQRHLFEGGAIPLRTPRTYPSVQASERHENRDKDKVRTSQSLLFFFSLKMFHRAVQSDLKLFDEWSQTQSRVKRSLQMGWLLRETSSPADLPNSLQNLGP
jgi:hypothetical protein